MPRSVQDAEAALRGAVRSPPSARWPPKSGLWAGMLVGTAEVVHAKFLELGPLRREYCANWAPREVAPPLLGAKAGWGRREPRWAGRAGQRAQAWTCPVRPRLVREELRRDAGECIGGKVGEGAFLVKGQDSCGGQATPSWGRLCALQPGGVWWCPHLV